MSPRVRGESVHPRLQSGASGRPLNFTVRGRGIVVLSDVVRMLNLLRTEEAQYLVPTIYAAEPWTPRSEALVALGSLKDGLPPEVAARRMVRLIEVEGAIELLKDRYFDLRAADRYDELSTLLIQRVIQRNSTR